MRLGEVVLEYFPESVGKKMYTAECHQCSRCIQEDYVRDGDDLLAKEYRSEYGPLQYHEI